MSSTPKVVQLHPASISIPTNTESATAQNEVRPAASRPLQRRSGATVDIAAALYESTAALIDSPAGAGQMKLIQQKTSGYFVEVACAGPLVVFVNEAVRNAIKHAHPSGVSGKIIIDFRQENDGAIVIEVVDDGVGLPEGFDPAVDGESGLRLIRRQAETCGGSVAFESSCLGLSVSVRVPPHLATKNAGHKGNGILDDTQQSRSILEALPSAIYTTDAAGRITFFNEFGRGPLGHPPRIGEKRVLRLVEALLAGWNTDAPRRVSHGAHAEDRKACQGSDRGGGAPRRYPKSPSFPIRRHCSTTPER